MRLLFAGTPDTALPSFAAVLGSRHELVAVLTRPEAPAGRGRHLVPSPVAVSAEKAGVEILTPGSPRDPAFLNRLAELSPDCCAIVAYGALVPPAALAIPRHGWVNLHFSLLPAWRGAAPVQHALLHGDDVTGATTFQLEEALDSGPVFGVVTESVRPTDTAGDLLGRLSESGAALLVATLDGIESGTVRAEPQPVDGVSFAPKVTVADAQVEWAVPAIGVDRLIRACTPAPGAWTTFRGERVKLLGPLPQWGPAGPPDNSVAGLAPGELRATRAGVAVGTGTTTLRLGEVRPQGRASMPADAWARGLRLEPGERLGDAPPAGVR